MAISDLITLGIGPGGSPTDIILMGLSPGAAAGDGTFDSVAVYAWLEGNWTDISADVIGGVSYSGGGISGGKPTDLLADTGSVSFTLDNSTGKYYPGGTNALTGWGAGVKIKVVITYASSEYIMAVGYITKDGLTLDVGTVEEQSRVRVSALDWMHYPANTPIVAPTVMEDATADETAEELLELLPDIDTNLDTGTQTFPTVFDSTGMRTTAYEELAKLAYSESPGRFFLTHPAATGQQFEFRNANARKTATIKQIGGSDVNFTDDGGIHAVKVRYGKNLYNYGAVTAHPRRVDDDPQVLYRLPKAMKIAAGEQIEFRARYVDPTGGGTRVNALVDSMITPEVPGDPDPSLVLLINCESGSAIDDTSRHTVTQNDVTTETGAYVDVGPEPDVTRIAGNILGQYALFGGYSAYYLSIAPNTTIYDDTDSAWTYTGTWTAYSGSGPYNSTLYYTTTVGDYAEITFTGTQVTLVYTQNVNRGLIKVSIDGVEDDTFDASGSLAWQQTWTSQVYADGTHTVRFEHAGGGTYIDVDAIQVTTTDFEFGSDAFTIGWYEALMDVTSGDAFMTRDMTASYPPWLLGYSDGDNLLVYMSSNGSSWDIADGKSLGPINKDRWTYYEVCRDSTGWFYAFVDGKLMDKWYSAEAFPANTGTLSIGRTRSSYYTFMGADSIFIRKGVCLHRSDFEPPRRNITATSEGDYLMNAEEDGSGADMSDDLTITATYSSEAVTYTLENTNDTTDAWITHIQARGRGVYLYDPIETIAQDADSIAAYGYETLNIDQPYQQTLTPGRVWLTDIITDNASPKIKLEGLSFFANTSDANAKRALQLQPGDLVGVTLDRAEIQVDSAYFVDSKSWQVQGGGTAALAYVTLGLSEGDYIAYPGILLHLNGADGSTAILDKSGKTWTANGDAHISANSKYYLKFNQYLALDGNDYIQTSAHEDFYFTGDFTFDFWFLPTTLPTTGQTHYLYRQYVDADNYTYIRYYLSGGSYYWELTHTVSGSVVIDVQRSTTGNQYVWRHMALVRSGNDYKWFRNGTQLGTTVTDDSEFTELDAPVTIGGYSGGTGVIGRIDEFRIVNGTAVWTDTFTPPTQEYGLIV